MVERAKITRALSHLALMAAAFLVCSGYVWWTYAAIGAWGCLDYVRFAYFTRTAEDLRAEIPEGGWWEGLIDCTNSFCNLERDRAEIDRRQKLLRRRIAAALDDGDSELARLLVDQWEIASAAWQKAARPPTP
jgi:hypothetical protein